MMRRLIIILRLTKKAEPTPTRDSRKTKAAGDGGWLRRLVRHHGIFPPLAADDVPFVFGRIVWLWLLAPFGWELVFLIASSQTL